MPTEFAKSRAMRACFRTWSPCQRACVSAGFTCQRACVLTCQKACQILVPINVSTCHMHANDSTWTPNISNGVSIFWAFLLRIDKQNFYNLLLYEKFYMILDVIVIYIICIGIAHRNCVILHFYTSCHVKEKCLEFFFFIIFCYLARNENIKRPSFYSLQVTRAFSSFPQLNN